MPDKTWIAFEISIMGWRGIRQIVAARNRGHAKAGQYRDAKDAGYDIPYTDFRARRAKQYDELAATCAGKRGPIVLGWEDKNDRESWGCLAEANTISN